MSRADSRRTGRRPGASDTREQIAVAARTQFAEQGYERATFRAIAAAAGVDPALVVHFYGSKEELFRQVMVLPPAIADGLERLADGPARPSDVDLPSSWSARSRTRPRARSSSDESAARRPIPRPLPSCARRSPASFSRLTSD